MSRRGYGRESEVDRLLRGHLREPAHGVSDGPSDDVRGCDGEPGCTAEQHTTWCRSLHDPEPRRRS